jgi:hypothetical protein
MEAADFCFMAPSLGYKNGRYRLFCFMTLSSGQNMEAADFCFMTLYSGQNIEAVDSSLL